MESIYITALRKRIDAARQLQADVAKYADWLDGDLKDCQINFRISKSDFAKLKTLARSRNMKYQTCLREIIKREIELDEGGGRPLKAARMTNPY